ncbi:hypothetical protein C8Q73DRAFT_785457 [Cubamyces lactineus]|nr:hypothetical protein C8Q73DRAFT_785457 [Cubamyces lactineus]
MSTKLAMHSMRYTSPRHSAVLLAQPFPLGGFAGSGATFNPWHNSWSPSYPAPHYHARSTPSLDLPYASKPRTVANASWNSLVGLDPHADAVYDPSEPRKSQPSPIGFPPHTCQGRPAPALFSPSPMPIGVSPPFGVVASTPAHPRDSAAEYARSLTRPSSAPPRMQRRPLSVLQEAVEENPSPAESARIQSPLPPLPSPQEAKSRRRGHSPSECAGDPLCATHRKRSTRHVRPMEKPEFIDGPHKRRPLALWQRRPKFGARQCDDFDCLNRNCADCAYLRNRGSMLWSKLVRPCIEDRLEDIGVQFDWAEDTLALLRFRATYQVRKTMA